MIEVDNRSKKRVLKYRSKHNIDEILPKLDDQKQNTDLSVHCSVFSGSVESVKLKRFILLHSPWTKSNQSIPQKGRKRVIESPSIA